MNEVRIHRATGEFLSLRFAAPATKDLSIVVPVKNEATNAAGLAVDISFAMEKTSYRWECIWVDDGSSDNTVSLLEDFRRDLPGHWILALSKGYGQSAALAAGIARARGRVIVTMDGDGENDPEEIPKLVSRLLDHDRDVVSGWRERRMDSFFRQAASRVARWVRSFFLPEIVRDLGCGFRAVRREAIEGIPVFAGMHRYLPLLARLNGFEGIEELPVRHRRRRFGSTKYNWMERVKTGLIDLHGIFWLSRRMVNPRVAFRSFAHIPGCPPTSSPEPMWKTSVRPVP